ncbi:Astacin-like metalloendopeptidase [Strongyloides ratti]|uniref:Metalloendopeptidase n=1 Tax=Strongyloides ratti TaxID=34506 RepID=A0A090KWY5_STRRB|nr:Astacin-like metalloendopeptidase [Strongyloides ratti]CEF59722.1 Astacin-like metalloendopeptidase [Strongyloides ratti]
MKGTIYIYIFTTISFILLICLWHIYRNLSYNKNKIIVSNDIIFEDTHIDYKRDILKDQYAPWEFPIKYFVHAPVSTENVEKAIKEITDNTCVKFEKKTELNYNEKGLVFYKDTVCSSNVGQLSTKTYQVIKLAPACYKNPYLILHEIGHALGLVHEHTRKDRDKYVKINSNNMQNSENLNFKIHNFPVYKNYSTFYDFSSLMHYGPYAFSTYFRYLFGYKTIESKLEREYDWMMGQRKKMTFNDYKQINLCYCNSCNWVNNTTGRRTKPTDTTTLCKNGGYPDFKNCSKCICPTGYTGDLCDKIVTSDKKCGPTFFNVNKTGIPIILKGKMNCYIFLKTKNGKKISLQITYVNAPYNEDVCTEDIAYQIKYRKDKGATGLLLCGHHSRVITLKSETNSILLFYKGISDFSLMIFTFKQAE